MYAPFEVSHSEAGVEITLWVRRVQKNERKIAYYNHQGARFCTDR